LGSGQAEVFTFEVTAADSRRSSLKKGRAIDRLILELHERQVRTQSALSSSYLLGASFRLSFKLESHIKFSG